MRRVLSLKVDSFDEYLLCGGSVPGSYSTTQNAWSPVVCKHVCGTKTANDNELLIPVLMGPDLLLLLWHAPLGVCSAKRRHQSPESTILSHVIQGEVIRLQVSLDSLHPRSMRASWWSPPVLQGEAIKNFLESVSYGIRTMWPNREKRSAWTIAERCDCPVVWCRVTMLIEKNCAVTKPSCNQLQQYNSIRTYSEPAVSK